MENVEQMHAEESDAYEYDELEEVTRVLAANEDCGVPCDIHYECVLFGDVPPFCVPDVDEIEVFGQTIPVEQWIVHPDLFVVARVDPEDLRRALCSMN